MSKNYDRLINNFKLLFPFSKKANLIEYLQRVDAQDSIEDYLEMIHYFLCQEKTDSREPEQSIYINDKENYKKPTLDTMPPLPASPGPSASPGPPASPEPPVSPASPEPPASPALPASPEPPASPALPASPEPPASPGPSALPASPEPPASPASPALPVSPAPPFNQRASPDDFYLNGPNLDKIQTFDVWIERTFSEGARDIALVAKKKFVTLFSNSSWYIVFPRGDGYCGLYAATIDYNSKNQNFKENLVATKSDIIDKLILGISNYHQAIERHNSSNIPLPQNLQGDPEIVLPITDTPPYRSLHITKDVINISEGGIIIGVPINKRHWHDLFRAEFQPLHTLPGRVIELLAYAYKCNYLVLQWEDRLDSINPFLRLWYCCYSDPIQKTDGTVIYPYNDVNATTLLALKGPHYYLFVNANNDIKAQTIISLKGNNELWGPRLRLEGGFKKIKKQKKLTATTYKNTLRRLRFTTNMKKPKYSIKKN